MPRDFYVQTVLLVVEALTYLGLAAWCLTRRDRPWLNVAAVGGLLVGAAMGVWAASAVEGTFFESSHIVQWLYLTAHMDTLILVTRLVGAGFLVIAFVMGANAPERRRG